MWYAPVGSLEYVRNLHNDKKIKEYLLNENRLKNNTKARFPKKTQENVEGGYGSLKMNKAPSGGTSAGKSFRRENTNTRMNLGKPITMKTQSALLVQIYRSYRKTALNVVSYAKNLKTPQRGAYPMSWAKGSQFKREYRKKR